MMSPDSCGGIILLMNRPAVHVNVGKLVRANPLAECCDCGKEAAEAAEDYPEQVWTVWQSIHIYCPTCATNEGIGPDD
jgi:hypothetical protein